MAAEVLRDDDVGGLLRPGARHLDLALLEDHLPLVVANDGVTQLPFELIERVGARRRKESGELESWGRRVRALAFRRRLDRLCLPYRLGLPCGCHGLMVGSRSRQR